MECRFCSDVLSLTEDQLHEARISLRQGKTGVKQIKAWSPRLRAAKIAAQEKCPHLLIDFTFHDLKAKGLSDLEGSREEKQAISGYKNSRQTAIDDRKTKIEPLVGGQKK